MLAEGLGLSGIVSILFTGIVSEAMKVFIFYLFCHLMSECSNTVWLFHVLGYEALLFLKLVRQFSEICICIFPSDIIIGRDFCVSNHPLVSLKMLSMLFLQPNFLNFCMSCRFIYMGFDIAMEQHSWSHIGFIFFSIVSLIL